MLVSYDFVTTKNTNPKDQVVKRWKGYDWTITSDTLTNVTTIEASEGPVRPWPKEVVYRYRTWNDIETPRPLDR